MVCGITNDEFPLWLPEKTKNIVLTFQTD